MTGSAQKRWELYAEAEPKKYIKKGEGSGEGRVNNSPGSEGGG